MLVQFQYHPIKDQEKTCVIALCDESQEEIAETSKEFFKNAGCATDEPNWGKFVYRTPTKREDGKMYTPGDAFILVACKKISIAALEYANRTAAGTLGLGACYDDYIRMCGELKDALVEKTSLHVDVGYEEVLGETEIYLEDDGGEEPYSLSWPEIDLSSIETLPDGTKFKPGDKVEIIARKIE